MKLWTWAELARLNRYELGELDRELRATLRQLEVGSLDRSNALATLENIRRILMLKDFHPAP